MKKRILVLCNPISGAGRAMMIGQSISRCLTDAGHEVHVCETRLEPPERWLDTSLRGIDALVVAGGDGAVRLAAASAVRTGTPIYQVPCGTENLFAREFGMTRNAEALCRAVEKFATRRVDVGVANGRIFLLMASVGFDADVVHDLASRRGSSISHFSYVAPIVSQLWRWHPPRLDIDIDGERLVEGQPGFVVIGNCRQYGWRLNPAGRAAMDDGLLDVVFFPACSRRELIAWAIRCRRQRHLQHPRLVYQRGRSVSIASPAPQRFQLDGDPPDVSRELGQSDARAESPRSPFKLEISLKPASLAVLIP